jgi:hypothetical protein
MTVSERILSIRLIERLQQNPALAARLGITWENKRRRSDERRCRE